MTLLKDRTPDQVESDLARVQAAERRLAAEKLRLLREADRMQVAASDGCRTMADWVAARLDTSPETARTLVATARGIESSPDLEAALADGFVSFDRTVELVRADVSGVDVSDHWSFDIAGLRRIISRRRGRTRSDDREAHDARYLVLQPSLDRSQWRLHGLLTGADGAVVERTLDTEADRITDGTGDRSPLARRRADALVSVCGGSTLSPELTVFLDADGATVNGHMPVGGDAIDETTCLGSLDTIDVTDPGRPLNRGRKTRVISKRLRRAVFHRDGGRCVVEGCSSRYRIQPHHLVPWSEGGPTDVDNLVTLCWYHHHVVVHGHGRTLDPASPPFRRRFLREPGRSPP